MFRVRHVARIADRAPSPRSGARALGAALLAVLCLPACLVEYAIGGASDTDDHGHHSDSDDHSDDTSGSGTCPEGQVPCGDGCAAAGACDDCPVGLVRCAGECVVPEVCADGQICPDGQIACGSGCAEPEACEETPTCPDGQVVCGSECAPAESCCEAVCDPVRELCDGDACRCRDGLVRCGEVCVDTRSDPDHCGKCDLSCGGGSCSASSCVEGCGEGRTECGGACVVLAEDPLHCDGCDQPCAADEVCLAGFCRPYGFAGECATCPCPEQCAGELAVCCDSTYLGAAVCIAGECG